VQTLVTQAQRAAAAQSHVTVAGFAISRRAPLPPGTSTTSIAGAAS
jgi:hypothetical protein